jgi:hypothetical protein
MSMLGLSSLALTAIKAGLLDSGIGAIDVAMSMNSACKNSHQRGLSAWPRTVSLLFQYLSFAKMMPQPK